MNRVEGLRMETETLLEMTYAPLADAMLMAGFYQPKPWDGCRKSALFGYLRGESSVAFLGLV